MAYISTQKLSGSIHKVALTIADQAESQTDKFPKGYRLPLKFQLNQSGRLAKQRERSGMGADMRHCHPIILTR